jgi:hypothetical protein
MIIVKNHKDLERIKNEAHRSVVSAFLCNVLEPIQEYANEPIDDIGYAVYIEPWDFPYASVQFYRGTLHHFDFWEDVFNQWENVDKIEDLYSVLHLVNDDFGITYFIPDCNASDGWSSIYAALEAEASKEPPPWLTHKLILGGSDVN